MKNIAVAALSAIILFSSVTASARELTAREKKVISDVARSQLKDPDSAKFYWQDYKGGDGLCAHVNAKNSYGGYTGKELMVVGVKKDNAGEIISADVSIYSSDFADMMRPLCEKRGYTS